jgi:hypothetical protein
MQISNKKQSLDLQLTDFSKNIANSYLYKYISMLYLYFEFNPTRNWQIDNMPFIVYALQCHITYFWPVGSPCVLIDVSLRREFVFYKYMMMHYRSFILDGRNLTDFSKNIANSYLYKYISMLYLYFEFNPTRNWQF